MNQLKNQMNTLLSAITPASEAAMIAARNHWDNIAKPLYGLGLLEDALVTIAGIQGTADIDIKQKNIVVMCADNGVVEEGISQSGQDVTAIVTENIANGAASVNRMAAVAGASVTAVDIGVAQELSAPALLRKKIAPGTKNLAKEAAMSEEEMLQAILTGIEVVKELKELGYTILGTGEMGIGNTTTSSALASVLLSLPAGQVTGRGAGLSREGVSRKIEVIEQAIALHKPDAALPLEALRKLGGLDIAGLTGVFLGGAVYKVPIVIDGLISGISALLAYRCAPLARQYMLPSHMGKEPAMEAIMRELSLRPIIYGELALGEGTGTALLFGMLNMAQEVYRENGTFEEVHIEHYEKYE